MTRWLTLLPLALAAACVEEPLDADVEVGDDAALFGSIGQYQPPNPIPFGEVCNDGKDNNNNGQVDESPCRKNPGFVGGSDDGSSIMDNPEDFTVRYQDSEYGMSLNDDGDIDITHDKELVGVIELSGDTKTAHVFVSEGDGGRLGPAIVLVLDRDLDERVAMAFDLEKPEGVWTTEFKR